LFHANWAVVVHYPSHGINHAVSVPSMRDRCSLCRKSARNALRYQRAVLLVLRLKRYFGSGIDIGIPDMA
jgi:hypothetical protein